MADWFKQHPEVGIINRDHDGLCADAARQGAPQARQVADRFHLLKNLRETIARQLGGFEAPIREASAEVCMNPCYHDGICRRTGGGPWSSPPPRRLASPAQGAARAHGNQHPNAQLFEST
jgi:hypothetical protein